MTLQEIACESCTIPAPSEARWRVLFAAEYVRLEHPEEPITVTLSQDHVPWYDLGCDQWVVYCGELKSFTEFLFADDAT